MLGNAEIKKACSKCGLTKPLTEFAKRPSSSRYGVTSKCKTCQRKYFKKYSGQRPLLHTYNAAKRRCRDAKQKDYANYGGRGIEFRFESYDQFVAEVGVRPEGTTLDRIDNEGHYEPGNVQWATASVQNKTKRPRRGTFTVYGKTMTAKEWSKISGVNLGTIIARRNRGWSHKESVFGRHDR